MQRLNRLQEVRTRALLTQHRLAEISGVARSTIAAFETGKRAANPITAHKLARALGVEPTDLVEGGVSVAGKDLAPRLFSEQEVERRTFVKVYAIRITEGGYEFLDTAGQVIAVERKASDLQFPGAVGEVLRLARPIEMAVPSAVA